VLNEKFVGFSNERAFKKGMNAGNGWMIERKSVIIWNLINFNFFN
jgi:hypothetical protein